LLPLSKLTESIVHNYSNGSFLMAGASGELGWYQSKVHAVFPLQHSMHCPRSLAKLIRRGAFELRVDGDFAGTVAGCGARKETWISEELRQVYQILNAEDLAHSFEAWDGGVLAGGILGLTIGSAFIGESMFYAVPNASKVALLQCAAYLRFCGYTLFDAQIQNPHLARFGAQEIERERYLPLLKEAAATPPKRDFATAWKAADWAPKSL
jgi:leucyl/phenylalanyl-tRNA--protein transferase